MDFYLPKSMENSLPLTKILKSNNHFLYHGGKNEECFKKFCHCQTLKNFDYQKNVQFSLAYIFNAANIISLIYINIIFDYYDTVWVDLAPSSLYIFPPYNQI